MAEATPGPRWVWLACGVLATFLAFPHPVGEAVIDLGLPVAFLPPAFFALGLRGLGTRRALGVGFVAGWLAHAAVLHWIFVVTVRYGGAWPGVGVLAVLLLAAYVGAFTGLWAVAFAWLERHRLGHPLALAAAWTAVDHLRSFALSGFPWATLGYGLHADVPLLGLAPVTGVYGLSFAAALGGTALAAWPRSRRSALEGLAVLVALHAAGAALRSAAPPDDGTSVRVAVIQGNIDQGVKWSPDWAERTLGIYEDLTREAARAGAEWVIWPETAVPGSPDADPVLRERLALLARQVEATLVVGAVGVEGYDPVARTARGALRYFDSAFVFVAAGSQEDRYDKTHLVPFGEYVPLRDFFGRFVKAVATGVTSGDVTPGARPRVTELPIGTEPGTAVGVPICYELLFPNLMRRFAADGARALLAITNDAWYGRTGAPHQFLVITALRSAESRLWTARAANTGVSALIDGGGRVREQTRIFERGLLVGDLRLAPEGATPTFYARHGDVFAGGCWLAGVVLAGVGAWRTRERAGGGGDE
jgi:apolipoprotein N-acyltransferase